MYDVDADDDANAANEMQKPTGTRARGENGDTTTRYARRSSCAGVCGGSTLGAEYDRGPRPGPNVWTRTW